MIDVMKFDIAAMAISGLLGIVALIGVCCGATHQWLMLLVCTIIFGVCFAEYRKNKK